MWCQLRQLAISCYQFHINIVNISEYTFIRTTEVHNVQEQNELNHCKRKRFTYKNIKKTEIIQIMFLKINIKPFIFSSCLLSFASFSYPYASSCLALSSSFVAFLSSVQVTFHNTPVRLPHRTSSSPGDYRISLQKSVNTLKKIKKINH